MSRISVFSSPYMLGFDEFEEMLENASKTAADGYPPYNIERILAGKTSQEVLRITLAVAGFAQVDLEIILENNQLVVTGRQKDEEPHDYLHRGIAARQFKKTFVLAEGLVVKGADMENGLLSIDLVRPQPERIVHNIEIKEK